MPPPDKLNGEPLTALLSITMARGGDKGSSLPGQFEINLNRRYLPIETFNEVVNEIHETITIAVEKTKLCDWSSEIRGHLRPVENPVGEEYWPRWIEALSKGFGWPLNKFRAWGSSTSSDMGWIQRTCNQEILLGGLGGNDRNQHAADENTTMTDLMSLARSIIFYFSNDFSKT